MFQIKQKFTSGYHPQTNGQNRQKDFNIIVADALAKTLKEKEGGVDKVVTS